MICECQLVGERTIVLLTSSYIIRKLCKKFTNEMLVLLVSLKEMFNSSYMFHVKCTAYYKKRDKNCRLLSTSNIGVILKSLTKSATNIALMISDDLFAFDITLVHMER